ncbi:unnamed protein product [Amoebophrya sp. A120]|nr:unnamed protein product [Amoebophrya sp. A120]|eukprot:GSA120T00004582001.1
MVRTTGVGSKKKASGQSSPAKHVPVSNDADVDAELHPLVGGKQDPAKKASGLLSWQKLFWPWGAVGSLFACAVLVLVYYVWSTSTGLWLSDQSGTVAAEVGSPHFSQVVAGSRMMKVEPPSITSTRALQSDRPSSRTAQLQTRKQFGAVRAQHKEVVKKANGGSRVQNNKRPAVNNGGVGSSSSLELRAGDAAESPNPDVFDDAPDREEDEDEDATADENKDGLPHAVVYHKSMELAKKYLPRADIVDDFAVSSTTKEILRNKFPALRMFTVEQYYVALFPHEGCGISSCVLMDVLVPSTTAHLKLSPDNKGNPYKALEGMDPIELDSPALPFAVPVPLGLLKTDEEVANAYNHLNATFERWHRGEGNMTLLEHEALDLFTLAKHDGVNAVETLKYLDGQTRKEREDFFTAMFELTVPDLKKFAKAMQHPLQYYEPLPAKEKKKMKEKFESLCSCALFSVDRETASENVDSLDREVEMTAEEKTAARKQVEREQKYVTALVANSSAGPPGRSSIFYPSAETKFMLQSDFMSSRNFLTYVRLQRHLQSAVLAGYAAEVFYRDSLFLQMPGESRHRLTVSAIWPKDTRDEMEKTLDSPTVGAMAASYPRMYQPNDPKFDDLDETDKLTLEASRIANKKAADALKNVFGEDGMENMMGKDNVAKIYDNGGEYAKDRWYSNTTNTTWSDWASLLGRRGVTAGGVPENVSQALAVDLTVISERFRVPVLMTVNALAEREEREKETDEVEDGPSLQDNVAKEEIMGPLVRDLLEPATSGSFEQSLEFSSLSEEEVAAYFPAESTPVDQDAMLNARPAYKVAAVAEVLAEMRAVSSANISRSGRVQVCHACLA